MLLSIGLVFGKIFIFSHLLRQNASEFLSAKAVVNDRDCFPRRYRRWAGAVPSYRAG